MVERIRIREVEEDEIAEVRGLVSTVFDQFVAPLFSDEGIGEFKSFIEPPKLIERLRSNSFILAAEIDVEMVGVIGVRDSSNGFGFECVGCHAYRSLSDRRHQIDAVKRCYTTPSLA